MIFIITMETKVCKGSCGKPLPLTSFETGRNVCKADRKAQEQERKAKALESGATKTCKECQKTGPASKFHGAFCETCYGRKKRGKAKQSWTPETALEARRHPEKCISCDIPFDPALFPYGADRGSYREKCQRCNNLEKRYEKYRNKKRAEDLEGYLKHQRDLARQYRKNHPEIGIRYNEVRKTVAENKIKAYRHSAKQRNLSFNENDVEAMMEKLVFPCVYCGWKSETVLNGLDRIKNDIGYTDENTVSCCDICNYMKRSYPLEVFIEHVKKIASLNSVRIEGMRTLPKTRLGFSKTESQTDRKKDYLTSDQKLLLQKGECYLCHSSDAGGIDRVNSNIGYTLENSRSCCTLCNYMKKDYDLDDFLVHIQYIVRYMAIKESELPI